MQPSGLWLPIVTFNDDAKLRPKWILREFDVSQIRPRVGGLPHLETCYMAKFDPGWEGYLVWQTRLPALVDHLTYHVNIMKLKWEIIWTGRLPHLPGIPHLHVNTA